MTDYEPLLRRAIGGLDRPDERARDDVYERARQALIRQMRGAGASDDEIDQQLEDIGAAVARIEDEIARDMPRPVPPQRRAPSQPAFEPSPEAAAVLRRGPNALIVVGVLAAILVAGFGAYYFSIRERPRPSPAVRTEAPPQPAARTETPKPPAATTTSQPETAKSEITLVDDEEASYVLRRQRVFYRTTQPPGTIIVSRSQKFLYLVQPNQSAIRYAIGTGPDCENVTGLFRITEKVSLPGSSPAGAPAAAPPKFALNEQFGPRALYFDGTHAVHGTAAPHQIGQSAPVGCFLSWKPDILDLYDRVQLNDRVVVAN